MLLAVELTKVAVALAPLIVIPRKRTTKAKARNFFPPMDSPPMLFMQIINPDLKSFLSKILTR